MNDSYPLYKSNAFAVAPQSQRFFLVPGEVKTGSIKITNPIDSYNNVNYKIAVAPYSVIDDEYTVDVINDNPYSDIVKWVTVEEPEGVIEPNTVKEVKYTITVPEDVSGGGHYFAFLVKNVPEQEVKDDGTVQVKDIVELSSIVYATVSGTTRYEGEVYETNVPIFSASNPFYISSLVKNTGNIHQDVLIKVSAENFFTGETEMIKSSVEQKEENSLKDDATASFVIMPETSRYVNVGIYGLQDLGVYRIHTVVSFDEKEYVSDKVLLMCPLWFIGLILLAILATVGMVIRRIKIKKKAKSDTSCLADMV